MKKSGQDSKREAPERQVVEIPANADLIEVITLIRASSAKRLFLALPARPALFEKFFELRLIRQNALLAQKELILVTPDPLVTQRARRLGLAVEPVRPVDPGEEDVLPADTAEALIVGDAKPVAAKVNPPPAKARRRRPIGRLLLQLSLFSVIFGALPVMAYFHWPTRATITIETDISSLRFDFEANLSQSALSADVERQILPLAMISYGQEFSEEVAADGRVDGAKASGVVQIYNCSLESELVVNESTIFIKDGFEFLWRAGDSEIIIPPSESEDCQASSARGLTLEAVEAGEEYNLEAGNYQIVGLPEGSYDVRGPDMIGGSAENACYTPDDLEVAEERFKQKRNDAEIRRRLVSQLELDHDLIPLEKTFQFAAGDIFLPATCPEVTENKISQTIVYYMGGVKLADVEALAVPELRKRAGDLSIIDNGLAEASYDVRIRPGGDDAEPTVQQPAPLAYYVIVETSQAVGGVVLDREEVLSEIAGNRANQVAARLRRLEGVRTVDVQLSPPWRRNLPENQNDILLEIRSGQDIDEEDEEDDG